MKVELLALTPNAEQLIERAARTCYQSAAGERPDSAARLLPKLIASGHESPFEHASATFRLSGVSRALTHQLVRHRLLSVSQKSQRYVTEANFDYVMPPSVPPEFANDFRADMEIIRSLYAKWKARGLKNEDARFVLPNASMTELVVSANFREYRHIFQIRLHASAQWEIRAVCREMLAILYAQAPLAFGDLWNVCKEPAPIAPSQK